MITIVSYVSSYSKILITWLFYLLSPLTHSHSPSSLHSPFYAQWWSSIISSSRWSFALTGAWWSWSSWCCLLGRCSPWFIAWSSFWYAGSPCAGVGISCQSTYFAILSIPTCVCAGSSCCPTHIGTCPHYNYPPLVAVSKSFLAEINSISSAAACLTFTWRV